MQGGGGTKNNFEGLDDDPYAITQIALCPDTKAMAVAGASAQVIFFKFKRKETQTETKSMEVPIVYEVRKEGDLFWTAFLERFWWAMMIVSEVYFFLDSRRIFLLVPHSFS